MTIGNRFGTTKYPYCDLNTKEHECTNDFAFNYLLNASSSGSCLRPCKINEYIGKITYFDPEFNKDGIGFAYFYKPPEAKKIEEEYLLYDLVAVISAVGGSLCLAKDINGKRLTCICTNIIYPIHTSNTIKFLLLGYIQKLYQYIQKFMERNLNNSDDENKITPIKVEEAPNGTRY